MEVVNGTCEVGRGLFTLSGNPDSNYSCYQFDESKVPDIVLLFGVPFFLSSALIEYLFTDVFHNWRLYRFNDTVNSLSHGLWSQIWSILWKPLGLIPYIYVFEHFALYRFPLDSTVAWFLVLLGVDLGYYWYHRLAHEVNTWWCSHATHHSSEEYNLSTALRQSATSSAFNWVCYLPLSLFFPPELYLVHTQLNLIYQFWIHTEVVKSLGPLEYILNSPSHHRVHHGRNPKYLDKNYAGFLIIWDRMFGTFQAEEEQPVYGLVHPLSTWSIVWGQFHNHYEIWQSVFRTPGFKNKLKLFYKPPGWDPATDTVFAVPDVPQREKVIKYDSTVSASLKIYLSVQQLIAFAVGVGSLVLYKKMTLAKFAACSIWTMFATEVLGLLMEDDRNRVWLWEVVRIVIGWWAMWTVGIPEQLMLVMHVVSAASLLVCFTQIKRTLLVKRKVN